MFRDCGESGFYANSYGNRTNLILVEANDIIYSKDSIPLGCRVYLINETYLGMVESCVMVDMPIGEIHEITLCDVPFKAILNVKTIATLDKDKVGVPFDFNNVPVSPDGVKPFIGVDIGEGDKAVEIEAKSTNSI